jgi:3-oxoacyl-[acyl-carrier-protein] synthase-3
MTLYSKIVGTGSYLPEKRVTNHELAAQLAAKGIETSDEWIVSRSGISARHYAEPEQASSDLGVIAARRALEMAGMQPDDIDLIIVASSTPDFYGSFPSTACIVQKKLGITNNCAAVDVQAVCSGFVYAVSAADSFIKSGMHKNVLVIGSEVFSRILNFEDRTTCVLFGDGAGAIVMSASQEPGILACKLHADGRHSDVLRVPGTVSNGALDGSAFLYMDGQAVFKLAVSVLEKVAYEALEAADMRSDQIDWLIPHQANIRIMNGTAKKLGLPPEKMVVTVDQHGNTSAASIPLALDLAVRDGRVKNGDVVMMEGVGGGFTWGAVLARM